MCKPIIGNVVPRTRIERVRESYPAQDFKCAADFERHAKNPLVTRKPYTAARRFVAPKCALKRVSAPGLWDEDGTPEGVA